MSFGVANEKSPNPPNEPRPEKLVAASTNVEQTYSQPVVSGKPKTAL